VAASSIGASLAPELPSSFTASPPCARSSSLSAALPAGDRLRRTVTRRREGAAAAALARPGTAVPLLVAVGLVLGAVLLAPEQPFDQEAICQRHNGVAACRVW
jgi:hypothetical protein